MPNAVVSDKFGNEQIENHRALGNRNIFLANVNGVQIVSTLNPYAVEFYPMHIRQQLQNRGDFNFESQAQRERQQQLLSEQIEERRQQAAQDHLEPQKELSNDQICTEDNVNVHLNEEIKHTDQMHEEIEEPERFEKERSSKLHFSIEDISEDLINEIKSEAGYLRLPQKCMKIVEIVAIEEITDETISKPEVNANKNTKEKIVPNNIMLDAKRLFFGSDLEFENNANNEVSNFIRNSEKIPNDETAKSADLKLINEEIKSNTNLENMENIEDYNHAYESDTDVLLQINKVSRSQTDIKPRMNVEILDGKAPPTSPRNDVYLHNQLVVQKRKYLSVEETKKRKISTTSRNTGKNTTGGGLIKKLPAKTTCREPTVSSTIKERPKIISKNKVNPLLAPKKNETTRQKLPSPSTGKTCVLQCQTSTSSTTTSRSTACKNKTSSDCIKNQKTPAIIISRPLTPSVPRSSVSQKLLKTTDCKSSSILKTREPMIKTSHSAASTNVRKSNNSTHLK